ncbi:MAG: hypothetical protein COA74_04590 [Gammaproteobacteria bacterium]|nr:MAG: hypothetical protein COA74_04590 [Gammaproteobacteria bacterium]
MQPKLSSSASVITILLLVILFAASYFNFQVPEVNENSSATDFSANNALKRLADFLPENNQPHSVNTQANAEVRKRIIEQLSAMDIKAEVQNATSCTNLRRTLVCAKISNIIAKVSGTDSADSDSSSTVLLMAHYDSHPSGPGAGDAGHAVAIILELLDMLNKQPPFKNDLVILINEGEEAGLLGAEAFMAEHPLAKTIDVVINLEARGNQGKSLLFETSENNYGLIKLYQEHAKQPFANSISYEIYKLLPNDTDLTVTRRYDISGVNFAFLGRVNHYHTALDNIENLSKGSVQHQGDNAYAMLISFLNTDLKSLPEGNAVYTDVLSSFMIVWPESMSVPLSFFALMLLSLIAWKLLRSGQVTRGQLLSALPFSFAIIIVSALSSWLVLFLVQALSYEAQPWLVEPIPMRAALWLLPVSCSLFITAKLQHRIGFWGLVMSGNLLLLIMAMATSLYLPGVSYLPLLPLLTFSVFMSLSFIFGRAENPSLITGIMLLSMSCMALLVFPFMLLLESAMGFTLAPAYGVLMALVILLVLPLFAFANNKTTRRLTLTTLVVSSMGIVITSQLDMFSKELPQALNFEYLQQGDSATVQALTRIPLSQKIIAESGFSNSKKITRPWSTAQYSFIEADSLDLAEPELVIISSQQKATSQEITVRFQSENNTGQFLLYTKDNDRLQAIAIDGQLLDVPKNKTFAQYFLCKGDDCNGLEFSLIFEGSDTLEIGLLDYQFGLPESLSYISQMRGELAHQIQTGDVTVVHKEFSLSTHTVTILEEQKP